MKIIHLIESSSLIKGPARVVKLDVLKMVPTAISNNIFSAFAIISRKVLFTNDTKYT